MVFTVAEFFAGMGLVREGLPPKFAVIFANDIDPTKCKLYASRFGPEHLIREDIARLSPDSIPTADLFTASFPCTDLSLAGNRAGLSGAESGTFWAFVKLLSALEERKPRAILIENVSGFQSSGKGTDLATAISSLNQLGYSCDLLSVDAKYFVPQSRPRLFIVASLIPPQTSVWSESVLRPKWITTFVGQNPGLNVHAYPIQPPVAASGTLDQTIDDIPAGHPCWWDSERIESFVAQLSPTQLRRLEAMKTKEKVRKATAYRRTRNGRTAWEIRADSISGCLRTTKGGSSKQALVEAGNGEFRVRWMTSGDYAALQGAREFPLDAVTPNQAMSALGDAVCVPVIRFLAESYLEPLLTADDRAEAEDSDFGPSLYGSTPRQEALPLG